MWVAGILARVDLLIMIMLFVITHNPLLFRHSYLQALVQSLLRWHIVFIVELYDKPE